jgi:phosphinothricin acetyltransferase
VVRSDLSIEATAADSADARTLIAELDAEIARIYPGAPIHGLTPAELDDRRVAFLVARVAGQPVACAAMRELGGGIGDIRRMYVRPAFRGRGIARAMLGALERDARQRGLDLLRIETGDGQPEAIALYRSSGYLPIPPFGEYVGNPVSRCFEKHIAEAARIRLATSDDCAAINDILNYYVERTTATFITEPQTLDQRLAWFDDRSGAHPVVVADLAAEIVGWAALSVFRTRAAYSRTVELGVYVRHDRQRRGIGRCLVDDLLTRAGAADHHVVVGGACSESTASIALLENRGFVRAGHLHQVGYKFGRWLDVVFLERILGGGGG